MVKQVLSDTSFKVMDAWSAVHSGIAYNEMAATFVALECSGRGLCDEDVGQCKCFRGYKGGACQIQDNFAAGVANALISIAKEGRAGNIDLLLIEVQNQITKLNSELSSSSEMSIRDLQQLQEGLSGVSEMEATDVEELIQQSLQMRNVQQNMRQDRPSSSSSLSSRSSSATRRNSRTSTRSSSSSSSSQAASKLPADRARRNRRTGNRQAENGNPTEEANREALNEGADEDDNVDFDFENIVNL